MAPLIRIAVALFGSSFLATTAGAQTGLVNPSFDSGLSPDALIRLVARQNNGKILVLGELTNFDPRAPGEMVRLCPDGSLDQTFNPSPSSALNLRILTIAIQTDDRILLGGSFFSGIEPKRLARLNPDGSIDPTFRRDGGPDGPVFAMELLSDGRILIGGHFQKMDGVRVNGVARLLSNGSIDPVFIPSGAFLGAPLHRIYALAAQPDGKILVGGILNPFQGSLRKAYARLHPDGSLDESFVEDGTSVGVISGIASLADGKALIAGNLQVKGEPASIARLEPDGMMDETFNAPFFPFWRSNKILVDGDGRILVFGIPISSDDPVPGIIRLHPDGARDWSLDCVIGGGHRLINAVALQPEGKLIVAGKFDRIDGTARNSIARLNETNASSAIFFERSHVRIQESGTNVTLRVARHGTADSPATVAFRAQEGSAKAGADFISRSGMLEFQPGDRFREISIPIIDDGVSEEVYQEFIVVLSDASGGPVLAEPLQTTVTILDDDHLIEWDPVQYSVNELGHSITVSARRRGASRFPGAIQVNYRVIGETATMGEDFEGADGMFVFDGGETSFSHWGRATIRINDDALVEGNETLRVVLSEPRVLFGATGAVSLGQQVEATVKIVDNDLALELPVRHQNGSFRLTSSASSAASFLFQASTNLIDWVSIFTNAAHQRLDFLDWEASNLPQRFYRIAPGP